MVTTQALVTLLRTCSPRPPLPPPSPPLWAGTKSPVTLTTPRRRSISGAVPCTPTPPRIGPTNPHRTPHTLLLMYPAHTTTCLLRPSTSSQTVTGKEREDQVQAISAREGRPITTSKIQTLLPQNTPITRTITERSGRIGETAPGLVNTGTSGTTETTTTHTITTAAAAEDGAATTETGIGIETLIIPTAIPDITPTDPPQTACPLLLPPTKTPPLPKTLVLRKGSRRHLQDLKRTTITIPYPLLPLLRLLLFHPPQ